jgi:hypothetical protein
MKIEAVTRRILRITSTDGTSKVLVFSSWNDVLDVLEHSLAANNISYVRMKGGRCDKIYRIVFFQFSWLAKLFLSDLSVRWLSLRKYSICSIVLTSEQWNDFVKVCFLFRKSQAALSQFKGQVSNVNVDKVKRTASMQPVQVLLMLIQHGANGLNLLEAQHVILVEPLLNPAAEAQAISRIHRVGQDKSTFVHRFIVSATSYSSFFFFSLIYSWKRVLMYYLLSGEENNRREHLQIEQEQSCLLYYKP